MLTGWMVSPPASRAMASAPLETRLRVTPVIADMRLRPSAEGALAPCADAAAAWSGLQVRVGQWWGGNRR